MTLVKVNSDLHVAKFNSHFLDQKLFGLSAAFEKVDCFVFSTLFVHLVPGDTALCSLLIAVTLFLIYFAGLLKCLAPGGLLVSVPQDLLFMACIPFLSSLIQALALGSTYTKHSYTADWHSESSSDSCSSDSCWASLHGCLTGLSDPKPWFPSLLEEPRGTSKVTC